MQRYQASLLITTGIWVLLACLSGCASSPDAPGFTKVKYTHVKDAGVNLDSLSIDPMIRFEREHYMHGAVTMEQRRQRLGHYYTFSWNAPANPSYSYRRASNLSGGHKRGAC